LEVGRDLNKAEEEKMAQSVYLSQTSVFILPGGSSRINEAST
jgi:hypothetical protein